jgi:hypothetical protein
MIIGITGFKRSGKNTVCNYLSMKYGFTEYAFASPIKEISYKLFDWNKEDDEQLKETIDPKWGISRREFWQWFGTEAMQYHLPEEFPNYANKIGRRLWSEIFRNLYEKNKDINYAISDFRFPHEQQLLTELNAITIKVVNRKLLNKDLHESEMHIETIKCDYTVFNETSFKDLYKQVDLIMKSISKEKGII